MNIEAFFDKDMTAVLIFMITLLIFSTMDLLFML